MENYMLLDMGLGGLVMVAGGLAVIAFLLTGICLLAKSIGVIRRELKNEEAGADPGNDSDHDGKSV